jgi:hypothetical protein
MYNSELSIDKIFKSASPEQQIIWDYIFTKWGLNVGIQRLYFAGILAGSVYEVYNNKIMYLAYDLFITSSYGFAPGAGKAYLYNENNVLTHYLNDSDLVWNSTAAALYSYQNNMNIKSVLFSRLNGSNWTHAAIIGFKITF